VGEKEGKYIAQGKSHVEFYELNGKLYFATHIGYYEIIDGAECLPVNAPAGYQLYRGGHLLPHRRTDLRRRKTSERIGQNSDGRCQRTGKPAFSDLQHS
jgi:hypothetical protein